MTNDPNSSAEASPGMENLGEVEIPPVSAATQSQDTQRVEAHVIASGNDLEYSPATLKSYLSTRKQKLSLGGITFPGLFADPHEPDGGWLLIAMAIELVTATVLSIIVVNVFNLPIFAGILPLIGFIGFDVLAAWLHHWPRKRMHCLLENQKLLVTPDMRAGRSKGWPIYRNFLDVIEGKEKSWVIGLSRLAALGIIILAIAKTLLLAANIDELGRSFASQDSQSIFASSSGLDSLLQDARFRYGAMAVFALLYGFVAYIHLNYTGWAIFAAWLKSQQKRDKNFRNADPGNKTLARKLKSETIHLKNLANQLTVSADTLYSDLVPKPYELEAILATGLKVDLSESEQDSIAPHTIRKEPDGTYKLNFFGVLMDEQLAAWVEMQPTDFARVAVALYGHKFQLKFIGADNIDEKT